MSSEKIDTTLPRPAGTIFDPDFDLYERKLNCFDVPSDGNTIQTVGFPDDNSNRPSPLPFGPVSTIDGLPSSSVLPPSTPTTIIEPTRFTPIRTTDHYPTTLTTDRHHFTDFNRHPLFEYDTTFDSRKPPTTIYPSYDQNRDRLDFYPLYKYPMLYEQNYPSSNNHANYPGNYAQNIPTVDDRYRPNSDDSIGNLHTTPRPVYGSGYGYDYTYGTPSRFEPNSNGRPDFGPTTPSPYNGNHAGTPHTQPNYDITNHNFMPKPDYQTQERPVTSVIPLDSTQSGNDDQSKPPNQGSNTGYDVNNQGQDQKPMYPINTDNGQTDNGGPPARPKYPYQPNYYPPEGNYHRVNNGQTIETYFNPDDYLQSRWKCK